MFPGVVQYLSRQVLGLEFKEAELATEVGQDA